MVHLRKSKAGLKLRQRNHAIKRCKERYEIDLTLEDYISLCDRIWAFIDRCHRELGVYSVDGFKRPKYFIWYKHILLFVAWETRTQQINTFLNKSDDLRDKDTIISLRQMPIYLRYKLRSNLIGVKNI